jgi:hypothetical protein
MQTVVDIPPRKSGLLVRMMAISLLISLAIGVIAPLVMAFARPRIDLSQLTPDPGIRGPGFGMAGRRFAPMTPEQRAALRAQRDAADMADGVSLTNNGILVQHQGITAEVMRSRAGAINLRFGYNGMQHTDERSWLLARRRLRGNTVVLQPPLTAEQSEALDKLAPNNAVVSNAAVHDKLMALCTPVLTGSSPALSAELRSQLMAALAELPESDREKLRADFIRRANAIRDLLTPEQQSQIRRTVGG